MVLCGLMIQLIVTTTIAIFGNLNFDLEGVSG